MANLYITEQNSVLRKTGDRLIVQKDDEILLDVQCHKVDAVLIFGNVQFTTQAVNELFEHGIEMAILSRTGRLRGQITSPATKNISLRINQFRKHEDEAFKLKLSRQIVAAKIANCLQLIRSFSYNHPELEIGQYQGHLHEYLDKVAQADRTDQLLGFEGGAAKDYFILPNMKKHSMLNLYIRILMKIQPCESAFASRRSAWRQPSKKALNMHLIS